MGIKGDRLPADPEERADYEEAQKKLAKTLADQKAAQQRYQKDLDNIAAVAASDARKIAEQHKAEREAAKAIAEARDKERRAYLAKPLTEKEAAELVALETMANGPGPYPTMAVLRMADLKIKRQAAEKKPEKDPEKKPDKEPK